MRVDILTILTSFCLLFSGQIAQSNEPIKAQDPEKLLARLEKTHSMRREARTLVECAYLSSWAQNEDALAHEIAAISAVDDLVSFVESEGHNLYESVTPTIMNYMFVGKRDISAEFMSGFAFSYFLESAKNEFRSHHSISSSGFHVSARDLFLKKSCDLILR